jgi:Parkin co-regulated protein
VSRESILEFSRDFFPTFSNTDALATKNLEVMCVTLKMIQQLVMSSDLVGPGLVPFYRQLLPIFNGYRVKNSKLVLSFWM